MNKVKHVSTRLSSSIAIAAALLAIAVCIAGVFVPQTRAYADDMPTNKLYYAVDGAGSAIAPGETFTVSAILERDGVSEYLMYALTIVSNYDDSLLELVSVNTAQGVDQYTDGNTITMNYLSPVFAGVTWKSPTPVVSFTFRAKAAGSAKIGFTRVNISNTTGMGKYPCTCTDATVTLSAIGSGSTQVDPDKTAASTGVVPEISSPAISTGEASSATTAGVAATEATHEQLVALDEKAAQQGTSIAVNTGSTSTNAANTANGTNTANTANPANTANSATNANATSGNSATNASQNTASANSTASDGGMNATPFVIGGAVIVVAGVAAAVVVAKRKK